MKEEKKEVKKEKKSFFSALLNRIRPDREKGKKGEERKKSGTGGTF